MKVTRIRVVGPAVPIDLPIVGLDPSARYLLKNVDGLGPPELDLAISSSLYEGGDFRGRRALNREVVIRVGLNPDYTIGETAGDLRDELYGMLSNAQMDEANVQLYNGNSQIALISKGYVKRFEIVPFAKDQEVQITLGCTNPYISAYPDSNSLMATTAKTAFTIVNGTAPAGFKLDVTFTAAQASGWTLSLEQGTNERKMFINYAFLSGDKLEIDTRPGSRSIFVTRSGVRTNIVWALATDSQWIMLHAATNALYTSDQNFNFNFLTFTKQYWGI